MAVKRNDKGTGAFELLSFVLLMVFFLGIGFLDGPEWCVDTPSYVSMDFSREPVYPLFLMGLRRLFESMNVTAQPYGLPAYLTLAMVLQSLLWVVAIHRLGTYIFEISHYSLGRTRALVLASAAEITQVGVALLNRFIAKRGSMYSESLMTESLAMPLFVLFTIALIKSFDKYEIKDVIKLFFMSVLICSIRKQMLICVLMWGFTSFVLHLFVKRHRSLNRFSMTVIGVALSLVCIALFDRGYNLAVRGVFAPHTGNSLGGLSTVFYTSSDEDIALFTEKENSEYPDIDRLVARIVDTCNEQELTIDHCPGYDPKVCSNVFNSDWKGMVEHYAQSYDIIGFDVVLPFADDYVYEHFGERGTVEAMMLSDGVQKEMFNVLLKARITSVFKGDDHGAFYVLTSNILKAFVISNANMYPEVLVMVSAVIYSLYLVLYIVLAIRTAIQAGKDLRGNNLELLAYRRKVLLLGFVVMTGLVINCLVTGALIFPQPRYMCYSMGLFYLSLFSQLFPQ